LVSWFVYVIRLERGFEGRTDRLCGGEVEGRNYK